MFGLCLASSLCFSLQYPYSHVFHISFMSIEHFQSNTKCTSIHTVLGKIIKVQFNYAHLISVRQFYINIDLFFVNDFGTNVLL
jgi:hypothetical protein